MSLPGCLVLKTRDGKVTDSLSKAVKKRSKNITAPMPNIASAILMSSPACSSLQGLQNPLDYCVRKSGHKNS
jgi:hypothetical protein